MTHWLIALLSSKVDIIANKGLLPHYNGFEIIQSHNYIMIHVEPYIEKLWMHHEWNTHVKTKCHGTDTIHTITMNELENMEGPMIFLHPGSWNKRRCLDTNANLVEPYLPM
jgi:hypothetical protein